MCTIRTSSESHIQWKKKHFNSKPIYFRIIADFEADIEYDISSIGKKQLILLNKMLSVMVTI